MFPDQPASTPTARTCGMSDPAALVHATAVAIRGQGILLMGASGSGKSDLALRMIERGAILICDDYCDIVDSDSGPQIHAKTNIAGDIEIRGVGIHQCEYIVQAPLNLALILDKQPERLPSYDESIELAGWSVPCFALAPFEASAPLKAEILLRLTVDAGRCPVRLETSRYNRGAE